MIEDQGFELIFKGHLQWSVPSGSEFNIQLASLGDGVKNILKARDFERRRRRSNVRIS